MELSVSSGGQSAPRFLVVCLWMAQRHCRILFLRKKVPLQTTRFKKVDSYHRATIEFGAEI